MLGDGCALCALCISFWSLWEDQAVCRGNLSLSLSLPSLFLPYYALKKGNYFVLPWSLIEVKILSCARTGQ